MLPVNLYEYIHVSENGTKYIQFVDTKPPPCEHTVVIENLVVDPRMNKLPKYSGHFVIVKNEHGSFSGSYDKLPDDFEILSPLFFEEDLARDFAKKEFGRSWRKTYTTRWFVGQYWLPAE